MGLFGWLRGHGGWAKVAKPDELRESRAPVRREAMASTRAEAAASELRGMVRDTRISLASGRFRKLMTPRVPRRAGGARGGLINKRNVGMGCPKEGIRGPFDMLFARYTRGDVNRGGL